MIKQNLRGTSIFGQQQQPMVFQPFRLAETPKPAQGPCRWWTGNPHHRWWLSSAPWPGPKVAPPDGQGGWHGGWLAIEKMGSTGCERPMKYMELYGVIMDFYNLYIYMDLWGILMVSFRNVFGWNIRKPSISSIYPAKKWGFSTADFRSDGLGDGIGRPHNGRDVDLPDVVQPFVGPTTKDHQARLLDGRGNLWKPGKNRGKRYAGWWVDLPLWKMTSSVGMILPNIWLWINTYTYHF